ncbi:flagellar protein FlaG [Lachnospira multipara]|jgi:flagellar protein FlaG|uniref:flagellar protein FlaG n=1 Tax=Lachnospira multipara TaxID=28051 RepID=UPI000685B310|nr:flagellar protein FlaG [Lachnospira multipara]
MAIDVGNVASYQNEQNVNVRKSQTSSINVETAKTDGVVSAQSKSDVTSEAVLVGKVVETGDASKINVSDESLKKRETTQPVQKETSLRDVTDFSKIVNNNTVAEFSYNEPTKRIAIKIKNKETNEVIKEIPSEKALEMLAKAWELAGIMVDEKR